MRWLDLGAGGEEYVRWRLEKFGDTFAQGVLQAGISDGTGLVAVPDGVHELDAGELHRGQGWGEEWSKARAILREVIVAELGAVQDGVALFECGGEAGIGNAEAEYVLVQPSLYGTWDGKEWRQWEAGACVYLRAGDCEGEKLVRFLDVVDWEGRLGFVSGMGSREMAGLACGAVAEAGLVESLVRGVRCVVVPAMDGETWAVWRKGGRAMLGPDRLRNELP